MAVFLLSKPTSFKSYLKTLTIPQGLLAVPQTVVLDNTPFCITIGLVYVMSVLASRRLRATQHNLGRKWLFIKYLPTL